MKENKKHLVLDSPIVFWAVVLFTPMLITFLFDLVPYVNPAIFRAFASWPYWLSNLLFYAAIFGPSLCLLVFRSNTWNARLGRIALFVPVMIVYVPLSSFIGLYTCLLFNACV